MFQTNPIAVNTLSTDPVGPGQMTFNDATSLADAYGGFQSIGIDPSLISSAAKSAGVTRQTVNRWIRDLDFKTVCGIKNGDDYAPPCKN